VFEWRFIRWNVQTVPAMVDNLVNAGALQGFPTDDGIDNRNGLIDNAAV